jgi:hypothetical protein
MKLTETVSRVFTEDLQGALPPGAAPRVNEEEYDPQVSLLDVNVLIHDLGFEIVVRGDGSLELVDKAV